MKTLSCWVLAITLCGAIGAAEIVSMPETLTLRNGAVLRIKGVVKWTSDGVVVRHAGGADPVRFDGMAANSRRAWEIYRTAATRPVAAPITAQTEQTKPSALVAVSGQVFSKGFDEPYKFPGATVTIYPRAAADKALEPGYRHPEMPAPAAVVKSDGDGRFIVDLPEGEYLAMARERRLWRNGNSAFYEWRVTFSASGSHASVLLDDSNKTMEQERTNNRR